MKNYLLVLAFLTILSCTNNNTGTTTTPADSTAADSTIAANVSSDIELANPTEQDIYNGYISLKNALIAADVEAAKKASLDLKTSLNARQGCENTALIADKIASAADIASQRKEFVALSSDVIALFKHADLKKGSIYVQHCPMANDGNGADWLASENKIRNPYYGNEMMDCGAVVQEIKTTK